jgi:hypothetical protein
MAFTCVQEPWRRHGVHHRLAHGGGERVAGVGAALIAGLEARIPRVAQHGGERHAGAQALAQRQHVGARVFVLEREELAGATDARLHLVEHQQHAARRGELAQAPEVARRRHHHAGLALDGLHQHRGHLVVQHRLDGVRVAEGHLAEALHLGLEERREGGLAAGAHGGQRAPVERVGGGHDLPGAAARQLPPLARQLDGALVGFRAGAAQEHAPEPALVRERAAEPHLRGVEEARAPVHQPAGLLRERARHLGGRVAQRVDRPALHEVEVALAVFIEQQVPSAPRHHARGAQGGLEDVHGIGGRRGDGVHRRPIYRTRRVPASTAAQNVCVTLSSCQMAVTSVPGAGASSKHSTPSSDGCRWTPRRP